MQTDLKLYGNELNYFTTYFKYASSILWATLKPPSQTFTDLVLDSIGYMVMLYPSCVLISHIGPSKWLPACEVSYG
jgi:hypothetical protein